MNKRTERRLEEASRWFINLQRPQMSARTLEAWKKWNSVPENRQAFDKAAQLWSTLDNVPRPAVPDDAGSARTKPMRWQWSLGMAAAATFVALAFFVRPQATSDVFETAIAEHKQITLGDGSKIQLGAKTALAANMDDGSRTVVLSTGEALFTVAHDARRPFKVRAGNGTITALGTAFNVRRQADDHVVVAVTEGIVQVQGAGNYAARLSAGEQVEYDARGQLSETVSSATNPPLAWQDGLLQYRNESLRNVVADVNRYSRRPVVLGDRAAGELPFTGTVFEREVDRWLGGLERAYPELEVIPRAEEVTIRSRVTP